MPLTLRLRRRVGAGAVSTVYSAVEDSTGHMVALKKSRISQRASRPTLRHEAATMQLLKGHSSVPDVLAYSHLPHFEYLAMALLGSSLSEVVDARGPLSISVVSNIATQMVDGLEHLHSFGLVHRDIKPHNILFRSQEQEQGDDISICLIDYGMVSKASSDSDAPDRDPEPQSDIVGTLAYASLRAHVSGRASVRLNSHLSPLTVFIDSELSYRDDLESLAYSLCSIALGSLPWEKYNWRGTYYGRVRQVYQQKKALDGKRLAGSLPKAFADLLDDSRRMSAKERPTYDALRSAFSACAELHTVLPPPKSVPSSKSLPADPPPPPIEVGQVVSIRIAPRLSIEMPNMQLNDPPFIPDSTITDDELTTATRLGVVASIRWVSTAYKITVVGIGRLPSNPSPHIRWRAVGTSLRPGASLELPGAVFYTFIRPTTLYVAPGQALVPKTLYVVDPATAFQDLFPPRDASARFAALESPDPDVRHDGHMQSFGYRVFATLAPVSIDSEALDTESDGRGWFNECARIVRRLHLDNCVGKWTGTPTALERVPRRGSDDSYWEEEDHRRWWPANVDRSATLTLGNCEGVPSEQELLEGLEKIESVLDEVPPGEDEWFSDN